MLFAWLVLALVPAAAVAQIPSAPTVSADSVYGSVIPANGTQPTAAVLPLSLDEAIRRGLAHNLQIALSEANRHAASGEGLVAIGFLMPTITWQAERSRNQINLEAEGFRPSTFASFPPNFLPPGAIANFQPLVTVNEVEAKATLHQTLFDLRSFDLYRAAKQEIHGVDYAYFAAQGNVLQVVADSYLLALADQANVANAEGLLATNAELQRQANLELQAGTIAKLDALRARVQFQQQQQVVIAQQDAFEKAKVALNREIGLAADQPIELTDATPYADLAVMPLDAALRLAYKNRQEYLRLQAELRSAQLQAHAARYERLPTLTFEGNYGLTGVVGGLYHGTFLAQGTLHIPLFKEAQFRGDRDVADAQTAEAMAQLANFRTQIEAQIRDSMLDVSATKQLVTVARSNVNLARASLSDATVRFKNGIDNDLPVVEAQSSLAAAQTQLVTSLYRYDEAKLSLARATGVIATQYRAYLGPAVPQAGSGGHSLRSIQAPAEDNQPQGQ